MWRVGVFVALAWVVTAAATTRPAAAPRPVHHVFQWHERVAPADTSRTSPSLIVDLVLPVDRPGRYTFTAPWIVEKIADGERGVALGLDAALPPRARLMTGTPFVSFRAGDDRLGRVSIRFEGRDLAQIPHGVPWRFTVTPSHVEADGHLTPVPDLRHGAASFTVTLRSRRPGTFAPRGSATFLRDR